jgi:hypothetical protein
MMKHLNVPGVESGSEKVITPEDTWCLENCQWSDDEPSSSAAQAAEDAAVDPEATAVDTEETEESEESDDDGSDDSPATGDELY